VVEAQPITGESDDARQRNFGRYYLREIDDLRGGVLVHHDDEFHEAPLVLARSARAVGAATYARRLCLAAIDQPAVRCGCEQQP
jgi:hypothetical protein